MPQFESLDTTSGVELTQEPPASPANAASTETAPEQSTEREWRPGWVRKQIRRRSALNRISDLRDHRARVHEASGWLLVEALLPWRQGAYPGQWRGVCALLGRHVPRSTYDLWRDGAAPAEVLRVLVAAAEARSNQLQVAVAAAKRDLVELERRPQRGRGWQLVGPDGRDGRGSASRGQFPD